VAELDDILTTEEAAKLLRVSERTLERWRVRRRIPYVEYPRQGAWAPVRFRRADILEWLRQRVVKASRNGDQVPRKCGTFLGVSTVAATCSGSASRPRTAS
jgi:excisionase family DNA binding protein